MKIARYFDKDIVHLGMVEENTFVPVDFDGDMVAFIVHAPELQPSGEPMPIDEIKLAPPVGNPSKIIAIGLNYLDHAREGDAELPKVPLVFAKFMSSLIGPEDQIIWDPRVSDRVDFEAELAVIIGKKTYRCPEEDAPGSIFGYTCANDVSARDLQFSDGQWVRSKSLDTFCPLGPWIVTAGDIPDPHDLDIKCHLNGQVMQESNTGSMIFKIPQLISFLSQNFTLMPGDIILTGTPHGVGAFRNPPVFMKDGDEVIVEIEKVGRLINTCKTIA